MVGTKKTGTAAPATKKASGQPSYKDMIKEAIRDLKERNGSSRQALKKYIQANFHPTLSGAQFDAAFNKAIKAGVEKGDFTQPKGPSGPVKLAKKETAEKKAKPAAKAGEKKPATGAATTKKVAAKTGASKTKASVTKKPAAAKSTATKPKKAATSTATATKKANSGTKRKGPSSAPAVVDQPAVLNKTKSGRVSKGKAPTPGSTSAKRSAAGKKGAAKSPATKKAAPAKTEA